MTLNERFKNSEFLENGKFMKLYGRSMQDCSREELYIAIGYLLVNNRSLVPFADIIKKQALKTLADGLGFKINFE